MGRRPCKRIFFDGEKGRRATGRKPRGVTGMTDLEWDQHRPYLEKRYMEDNLPLPDLMKEMEGRGFIATPKMWYRLADLWGLRKYGQNGAKQRLAHDARTGEMSAMSGPRELPSRKIASLVPDAGLLFTDKNRDSKLLKVVSGNHSNDVVRCLRLCVRWCQNELLREGAQLTAPWGGMTADEIDASDSQHGYHPTHVAAAPIFLYLLDRYVKCPRTFLEEDSWDTILVEADGFHPLLMLAAMSGLITSEFATAASMRYGQKDGEPYDAALVDTMFDVARIGLEEINSWGDNMLVYESGKKLEIIIKDYREFGWTMRHCVARYRAETWPKDVVQGADDMQVEGQEEESQGSGVEGGNYLDDNCSTGFVDVNVNDDAGPWMVL